MRNVRSALAIALALGLMTGLLVVAPVAAFTPDPDFTRVVCYYSTRSVDPWEVVLRQLDVKPPKLGKQTPGAKVGWRFVVRRDGTKTYASPIQKSTANANGYLAFKWMSVDVRPPGWPAPDHFRAFAYRVTIKVFRYAADGSVRSVQRTAAYDFRIWIDGEHAYNETEFCYGRMRDLPEE